MFENKKILCVSAHMDDIEFGCGGLIKSLEMKSEIFVLALSKDRKSSRREIQEIRKMEEQYASLKILGVKKENLIVPEGIPGQLFPEHRQEILEEMYRVGSLVKPDIIITPSMNDVHHDHRTTCFCAQKAFKRQTRMSYEIVNAVEGFNPNLFCEINEESLCSKVKAIQCYKTQLDPDTTTGNYFDSDIIRGIARMRGAKIGVEFAEAFEVGNFVCKM